MHRNGDFWRFFDAVAGPQLALREKTFRKAFEYLDSMEGAITIVETGCARSAGNWAGDGQSTILFDKYVSSRDGESACHTVDINAASIAECRKLVGPRVMVNQGDSVHYLGQFAKRHQRSDKAIALLYLDSLDLNVTHWYESAIHHLKELAAIMRCIDERTLVMVDDCPLTGNFVQGAGNQLLMLGKPQVGGKGRLVAEYADAVHAKLEFAEYQAGWTGF